MRRLPNDTITLSVPDISFETLFGDPDFPANAHGGNDIMTVSVESMTSLNLVGDTATLLDHSRGGNDTLRVNIAGSLNTVIVDGDAQSMSGHAKGGNDTVIGDSTNSIRNGFSLYGDAEGAMSDHAQGGNDTVIGVFGGRSLNTLVGDGGSMSGDAHGGNDTMAAHQTSLTGSAVLYGDALGLADHAQGGNDDLTFTIGKEAQTGGGNLYGDAHELSGDARGGNDTLTVVDLHGNLHFYSFLMVGDAFSMFGNAHGGNDVLTGGSHADILVGDARHYYPAAPGSITGGRDILNGKGGNDEMWGGPNSDTFAFDKGSGQELIHDFNQGNIIVGSAAVEHDLIDVRDYGFVDWTALKSLISDNGSGNAVIHLTASDTITLQGVQTADLHATDFIV
ncbi:hypothetical protein P0R31_12195 [Bradyrhizobium yuanmingense]|uniref:hypothetical protein n=1 Tax=Bradyrhizobium yuanmingense TaxID=108015 RepID=UPI0023B97406|nr:hypothetical protein [Bradyrhizobium yuanmingense]MDF0517993.1 hypothetical protein [Bradyrhizobium yuanmingense]